LELTKTSNELKNANELLKNMDEQKDEFLYTVTHELRTPLSSIRALSEILYDNPDLTEEEKEQFLATIVHETERLSHLISQVLRLEKFESGRQRLNFTSFDYHEMITEAITPLQVLAAQKNCTVQVVKPNNELLFYGDRDMMNQVITNLVSNAIKFLDKENPSVAVRIYVENQEIITEIEDNGKGIEPDLTEKIFDKFFQAKNQTLKKPEGSGLGLAICQRIIELHQGKIWAVSELGKYAKFIFTLPLERIQEE
jgi:signal transduction histidine kinase